MPNNLEREAERRWSSTPIYGHRLGTLTVEEGNKLQRDAFTEGGEYAYTLMESEAAIEAAAKELARANADELGFEGKALDDDVEASWRSWTDEALTAIKAAIERVTGGSE